MSAIQASISILGCVSVFVCVCVRYLSIHAGHGAAGHAVGHISMFVDVVAEQILESSVTELEQLVRIRRPTFMRRKAEFA